MSGSQLYTDMYRALSQRPYSIVHTFDKRSHVLWLAKHSSAGNNE